MALRRAVGFAARTAVIDCLAPLNCVRIACRCSEVSSALSMAALRAAVLGRAKGPELHSPGRAAAWQGASSVV